MLKFCGIRRAFSSGGGGSAMPSLLALSDEVRTALAERRPVVALESTIVTHGMPFPDNLAMARRVESLLRSRGVTPATVALFGGKIHVGLSDATLAQLADPSTKAVKTSRRDVAAVLSNPTAVGGTTVAATMMAAAMAGVPVFATGGIGGVHRGATETMDISADLTELGRTPVGVVCAGVKSILDIPLTLEYLETQGVPVATVPGVVAAGEPPVAEFPAFFTRRSGCKAPLALPTPQACAALLHTQHTLGLQTGAVFAVPIPRSHEAAGAVVEEAIQQALAEARQLRVAGRDVTPFILRRVNELTRGASLQSNIALVLNNAAVAAEIAIEYAQRADAQPTTFTPAWVAQNSTPKVLKQQLSPTASSAEQATTGSTADVVVVGGATLDIAARPLAPLVPGTTNTGVVTQHPGGVGRNVAEALHRCGARVHFVSVRGAADAAGAAVADQLTALQLPHTIERVPNARTACYTALLDHTKDLAYAVGDMDIFDVGLSAELVQRHLATLSAARVVVADGNLTPAALAALVRHCFHHRIPVFFEPTSVDKARRPFDAGVAGGLHFVKPNERELVSMATAAARLPTPVPYDGSLRAAAALASLVSDVVPNVLVSLGSRGVLVPAGHRTSVAEPKPQFVHVPPPVQLAPSEIVDVTGAGDTFAGAFLAAWVRATANSAVAMQPEAWIGCVQAGLRAAAFTLRSPLPVSPDLTPGVITPPPQRH